MVPQNHPNLDHFSIEGHGEAHVKKPLCPDWPKPRRPGLRHWRSGSMALAVVPAW